MTQYSQAVTADGPVILCDGLPMDTENVVDELNLLLDLIGQLLPYAEQQVLQELSEGGCGPGMSTALDLINQVRELLE